MPWLATVRRGHPSCTSTVHSLVQCTSMDTIFTVRYRKNEFVGYSGILIITVQYYRSTVPNFRYYYFLEPYGTGTLVPVHSATIIIFIGKKVPPPFHSIARMFSLVIFNPVAKTFFGGFFKNLFLS